MNFDYSYIFKYNPFLSLPGIWSLPPAAITNTQASPFQASMMPCSTLRVQPISSRRGRKWSVKSALRPSPSTQQPWHSHNLPERKTRTVAHTYQTEVLFTHISQLNTCHSTWILIYEQAETSEQIKSSLSELYTRTILVDSCDWINYPAASFPLNVLLNSLNNECLFNTLDGLSVHHRADSVNTPCMKLHGSMHNKISSESLTFASHNSN